MENHQRQNGKIAAKAPFATFMQPLQQIYDRDCKTQSESQDSTEEQVPFERPWRSHSTEICTD